jgi:hypothetical protein
MHGYKRKRKHKRKHKGSKQPREAQQQHIEVQLESCQQQPSTATSARAPTRYKLGSGEAVGTEVTAQDAAHCVALALAVLHPSAVHVRG